MFEDSPPGQPRRIALKETFRESLLLAWNPLVLRMPMLWLPIALNIVLAWMFFSITGNEEDPQALQKRFLAVPLHQWVALIACFGLYLAATFGMVVSWLRYVLRQEPPSGAYFGPGFWRFVGYGILLEFVTVAVVIGLALPFSAFAVLIHPGATQTTMMTSEILGLVAGGATFLLGALSMLLLFVAAAIDDTTMTWRTSFRLMKPNAWRYIGIWLMFAVPVLVVQRLLSAAEDAAPASVVYQMLIDGLGIGTVNVFKTILDASLMASVYRQLVPGAQARQVIDV